MWLIFIAVSLCFQFAVRLPNGEVVKIVKVQRSVNAENRDLTKNAMLLNVQEKINEKACTKGRFSGIKN